MKRLSWIGLLVLAPALAAQVPADSGMRPDAEQVKALREQVRQRWNERVRSALELNDEQAAKLQQTEQRFDAQRQPIRARQRDVNQALRAELQSSAPEQSRVTELMNEQQQNRAKIQEIDRNQDREMQGYLSPVQRARYQNERRQFQEKVAEIVRHRPPQRRAPPPPPRAGGRKRPRP
jgi:Spy/CpxP family protein refolding chaperone